MIQNSSLCYFKTSRPSVNEMTSPQLFGQRDAHGFWAFYLKNSQWNWCDWSMKLVMLLLNELNEIFEKVCKPSWCPYFLLDIMYLIWVNEVRNTWTKIQSVKCSCQIKMRESYLFRGNEIIQKLWLISFPRVYYTFNLFG